MIEGVIAQRFRWSDVDGTVWWFDVEKMRVATAGREPLVALVDKDEAELIAVANDINRTYATNMPPARLREPILVWQREDGSSVVVDGSHRLWRNAMLARPQLMHAFKTAEIGPFLIQDAAELEVTRGEVMSRHRDAALAEFGKRGRL